MAEPYYSDDAVTIYHGDCREVLPGLVPDLGFDVVLATDPPYGVAFKSGWTQNYIEGDEDTKARDWVLAYVLFTGAVRGALVFGSPSMPEPPGVVARLVWHRPGSGMGDLSLPWKPDWEIVYVMGGGFSADTRGTSVLTEPWDVYRGAAIHPHQKPLRLMRRLLECCEAPVALDPFMGSGSTLRAAKDLNRKAIGIEVDERYCEIAAKRMGQEVLDLSACPPSP